MLQELINKLNDALTAIQGLQIQATESSCTSIVKACASIREAAQIGVEMSKALAVKNEPETTVEEVTPESVTEDPVE